MPPVRIPGPPELEGVLDAPPEGTPPTWGVVVSHPHPLFGGTMGNTLVRHVAHAARDRGALALRYNFRGVGRSEGEFGGLTGEVQDVAHAVAFLRAQLPEGAPLTLSGFSFGAVVTTRALRVTKGVTAVALAGLPLESESASLIDWDALRAHPGRLLVIQGENDEFGAAQEMRNALSRERVQARFVDVARCDHFFTGKWGAAGEAAADFLVSACADTADG